ncbi:MAG: ribonuclease H [Thermodesulfobacteriota bacterium]|nr:ribonuclease H [Thermodesulfobacteriota bacterium]
MREPYRWKRMMFKGNKVWLAVDVHEHPVVKNHKVLIKYQQDQDYEYWVPPKAVQPIDPDRLTKKGSHKKTRRAVVTGSPAAAAPVQPGTIVVYTDGASSGNPGPAGIGIVLRFESRKKEISTYIGTATNNIAELMAIKKALEAIRTPHLPVHLYTDSQYCYGLLVLGWKARRNEELVGATKKLMKKFKQLSIHKIEGHAGIADNERADRLARLAVHKGAGT